MSELIQNEFRFLVDKHSFMEVKINDLISYKSESLIFTPTYNERDGFDTRIVFPLNGSQEISVGTILSSLDKGRATKFSSWIDTMRYEVSFIKANLERLSGLPKEIYNDCCELRFWHAADYRNGWGSTITMDAHSISKEKARLKRIQGYFED